MKKRALLLTFVLLFTFLFIACAGQNTDTEKPKVTPPEAEPEVTTTASIVANEAKFKDAISNEGTWIIALTKDLTIEENIVLDGEYTNGKKDEDGNEIIQRKIALYSQDENRNITDRYTLTAPKFTIKSPNASLQHGTFKGDLYVAAKNFELVDTKVDGDVYFTNEEAKSTFSMDNKSEISGEQKMQK